MQLVIKGFNELSVEELYEIYKLRVAVFVVEQNCSYQEIDEADKVSYHLYLKDEGKIVAYLRVLPKGVVYEDVSIGRVLSVKRRCGLATRLLREGIQVAKERFGAKEIVLGAQVYAKKLYENAGFVQEGEEYLEDGIAHVHMRLKI